MRKTFKLFCAAAMAALAVSSCYDDSFLRGEIDRLDGRVDSLASVLNKDVANLAALQSSVTTLETSLKQAIADGDAAVKKALEDALAAAEADLAAAIAKGDKAAADALAAEKTKIDAALKALETGLGSVTSDVEALEAALKVLEATVGTNYQDLLKKIDAVDGVVDGHIADMKTALDALAAADEKFNKDLAAAVAKIVVSKVEEVNGKIVITLADGETVEISKPVSSSVDTKGLVTIVEVEGVKYWSVVGAETHTGVQVGHPQQTIEFQINPTTKELEYRVNDGKWTGTGVKAEEKADFVITGFEETDDYVTITIGSVEYTLPRYEAKNESLLLVKSGKTYFNYNETLEFSLAIAGIESYYVMSKPDGWRASVKDGVLTVTSPVSADLVDQGVAEDEGQVLLHANAADGTCKVASLAVSVLSGFTMSIDAEGTISIVNPLVYYEEFGDVYIGLAPIAEFEKNPVEYVNAVLNSDIEGMATNLSDLKDEYELGGVYNGYEWSDGEVTYPAYEVDQFDLTVAQIYEYFTYSPELPKGSQFVVYGVPYNDMNTSLVMEDMVYVYYAPVEVDVKSKTTKFNEIELDIDVMGASNYYIGATYPKIMCGDMDGDGDVDLDDIEEVGGEDAFMTNSQGPFGSFQQMLLMGAPEEYLFMQMGILFENEGPQTISVSEIIGEKLSPNTEYFVWVFPLVDGKDYSTYEYEKHFKPYVYTYKTSALVSGGTLTVEFDEEASVVNYTKLAAYGNADEAAELIYYNAYTADEFNTVESNLAEDLLTNGYPTVNPRFEVASEKCQLKNLKAGETIVFAALAIDAEGKYGQPVYKTYTTKELEVNTSLSATCSPKSYTFNNGQQQTTVYMNILSENTNIASIRYVNQPSTDFSVDKTTLPYSTGTEVKVANMYSGHVRLNYLKAGQEYKFGYVLVDTDGKVSEYKEFTYTTPEEVSVVSATTATPATTMYDPTKKTFTPGSATYCNVRYEINIPKGAIVWHKLANNYDENAEGADLASDFVTGKYSGATITDDKVSTTGSCYYAQIEQGKEYKLYIVWMDAEGNFYKYVENLNEYITTEKAKLQ